MLILTQSSVAVDCHKSASRRCLSLDFCNDAQTDLSVGHGCVSFSGLRFYAHWPKNPKEMKVETFRINYLIRGPKVEKLSLQPISMGTQPHDRRSPLAPFPARQKLRELGRHDPSL